MRARVAIPAICCALALSCAMAQTGDAPKAPATPPDLKAYRDATKETDPEKKIAALEKWKAEFPESLMRSSADREVLSTLAGKLPSQQERIRRLAAALYSGASAKEKGATAYGIADELLRANVLLRDARKYAKQSVAAMRLAPYVKEQLAGYEKRKQKPPTSAELKKRFEISRAPRLAVLGRIEVRLGHIETGRKLLEEANGHAGNNGVVLGELGVLAAKAGNDPKAIEYLIPAKLSGRATKEAAEAFETVYRKQHNGSSEGMEALLDAEYNKRYPNPLKLERYKAGEKRSDRVVLAEVFTGSGCAPCAGADLAFDAAMQRYSRADLAVVMYHEHVPRPDPMTNPETLARAKAYAVNGVPTFAIDGKSTAGGGTREMAKSVYGRFNPGIEEDLDTPAEAHITVGASQKDQTVSVNALVRGVTSESKDLKVLIALVEKELRFNGENGIRFHPMVVRSIKSFEWNGEAYRERFDLDEISKAIKEHLDDYEAKGHRGEPFHFVEKKYQIDQNDLAVVVFVQDEKTKHVLQAAYTDLGGETARPTLEANNGR